MIDVCSVANSILAKSFEDKIFISPIKLNYIVYLLYLEYLSNYGKELINERFVMTQDGLVIPTLNYKFGCYNKKEITTFSKDANGDVRIVEGNKFNDYLEHIWVKYKRISDVEILKLTKEMFNAEENKMIGPKDILEKEIVYQEKKLSKIKEFHNRF